MKDQTDSAVRTERLGKRYGNFSALVDLNLQIPRGKIFGYIGPNGAGKTTTIRILAGLLRPSTGRALVSGLDCWRESRAVKREVGYLPDSFGVYDEMRVWEYLDFFGAAFKLPRKQRLDRMDYVMELTGTAYMRDRFVDALSHGMKQRVGIARVLLHDPGVLLLDEPASGLDPRARVEMRQLLRRLADLGKTILVSSHILHELASVCDVVGMIHDGRMLASGPVQTVLAGIRQKRTIDMQVLGDVQAAKQKIKTFVPDAELEAADPDEQTVRFETDGDDANVAALLEQLIKAGVRVVYFHEVPVDLEEAFLTLTARSK